MPRRSCKHGSEGSSCSRNYGCGSVNGGSPNHGSKVYTVGDDDVHEVVVDTGSITDIDTMALVVANMVRHRNTTLAMSVLTIVRVVADTAFALEPLMALVRLKISWLILRKSLE